MSIVLPVAELSAASEESSSSWNNESQRYQLVGEIHNKDSNDNIVQSVPWVFRFDRAPIEATGLSVDMFTRATVVMSSIFLGPALLELANDAVAHECEHLLDDAKLSQEYQDCLDTVRIYGFKPSSLLSNIAVGGGILGAILLPPFGAIVDRTPYRKQVGMYSAMLITVVKPIEIMISPDTWFVIAWLQVLTAVLFCIHISAIYAYTSELSDDPKLQTKYNTYYFVILYASTLVFMVETLGTALIFNADSVGTAQIALCFATVNCVFGFTFCWKNLFRNRPALTQVHEGSSIIWSGFRSLGATIWRIHRELPALRWLMFAIVCGESGNAAVVTIGTTFMVHFLEMDGKDVGIVFFALLLMGPLGAKLGEFITLRTNNPVTGAKLCMATFVLVTSVAAATLTGPDRSQYMVIFGKLWGVCLGWLHPLFTTSFIALRPSGMDAQMMGLYLFCCTGFSWLPPLVFTLFNEYGFPITWSLASLNIFHALGILFLFAMGSYEKAVEATRSPRSERLKVDDSVLDGNQNKISREDTSLTVSKHDDTGGAEFEKTGLTKMELPAIT